MKIQHVIKASGLKTEGALRDISFNRCSRTWEDEYGVRYCCTDITHMLFMDDLDAVWKQIKE